MCKTTFTEEAFTTLKALSEKDFQDLLYAMCKTKYPEVHELWFRMDISDQSTAIDIKYANDNRRR